MIFLICFVLLAAKLISCCRRWGKDLEEKPDEITWADIKKKFWFKILVVLRMILLMVSLVMGYYYIFGYGEVDKWANEAADSWDKHFQNFQHHQHDINATLQDCQNISEPSISDNLEYVQNYSYGFSEHCLKNLSLDNDGISALLNSTKKRGPKYPVLVTAVANDSYQQVLDLIGNIQSVLIHKFPKLKVTLHIYDFGLNETQRLDIHNCTFCELQRFPMARLKLCGIGNDISSTVLARQGTAMPKFIVDVLKPSLLQMELQKNAFVMWIQPNIRFKSSGLFKDLVKDVTGKSITLLESKNSTNKTNTTKILNILGEDTCLSQEDPLDTDVVLIRRNNFTLRAVMKPWVAATFKVANLARKTHVLENSKYKTKKKLMIKTNNVTSIDGLTRNLDRSVLDIVLTRLFGNRKQLFLFDLSTFGWLNVPPRNESKIINYQ